jgi:putative membrane protein
LKKTGLRGFFYKILCGFLLGLSIVAPGISGSVIAVMMGIYDELISIVANPFRNLKKNILYLIPMGIGAVVSAVLFVVGFKYLFENYLTPTFFLFIALIVGMFPSLYKKTKVGDFEPKYGIAFGIAIVLSLGLALMNQLFDEDTLLNQLFSLDFAASSFDTPSWYFLCLCGLVAGMVSIIPGMSVSIVLMVLGVYTYLMTAAAELDVAIIGMVGISFVVGMVLFSKVVKYLFDHYSVAGYYAVFGFMIGSIFGILPPLPVSGGEWLLSVGMLAVGGGLSALLSYAGKKLNVQD